MLKAHFRNRVVLAVAALGAFFAVADMACAAADAGAAERTPVVAVIPSDSPPTYFRDQRTGKAAGFAVDVMTAVAGRAGLQVTFVFEDSWADIIGKMKRGAADVAPGMGVSRDREKDLDFTALIDTFPISFFVRSEHAGIASVPGDHSVGVIRGSVAFEKLQGRPDLHLVLYESFTQGLFDLLAGKIEAFACPAPTLWQLARESRVEGRIKVVDRPIAEIRRAIAVRKNGGALLDRLNKAIEAYVGSPAYQQVYAKWYGKPTPYWTPGRTITFGLAVLLVVIGLTVGWRYLSVMRLNRELTRTIALRKEAEDVLRSFLNAITESAVLIERGGRILAANETVARRLDRRVSEIIGRNVYDILPKDVGDMRRGHLDRVFASGRPVRFEDVRKGMVFDNSLYPVIGPDGTVTAVAIFGIDISDRKLAEATVAASEKKYRMLYDSAIDAIFIIGMDGNFIDINRIAHERLGYTREEMLAMHLSQLDPPDFAAQVNERIRRLKEQGSLIMESAHTRKDGTIMPVEINAKIIGYDGGKAIFSIVRDMTERKLAEREREKLIVDLQQALAEIKSLHGILPICSSCKKIRDDSGAWHQMETYIREHTDADFSHGLCADCAKKLYPDYMKEKP